MTAVRTAPASTPKIGLRKTKNKFWKAGTSAKPLTAEDMVSMPNMRVAKPKRIMPVSFLLPRFEAMYKIMPMSAKTGVKELGFKNFRKKASLSIPPRLKSQAVTVVPMLAPIMTLIACFKLISPELTNPTTITVVAEEL